MPYCTQTDLENHMPRKNLIALTDDENLKVLNAARMIEAIANADAIINGFLGGLGLPLPLNPIPDLIKQISIDLSIWALHNRRFNTEIPKNAAERYDNSLKLLEKIQAGKIVLDVSGTQVSAGTGAYKTGTTEADRIFTKDLLDKY